MTLNQVQTAATDLTSAINTGDVTVADLNGSANATLTRDLILLGVALTSLIRDSGRGTTWQHGKKSGFDL